MIIKILEMFSKMNQGSKTIKKNALLQFLLYAPDEIDVEQLLTLIEAKATIKKLSKHNIA